MAIANKMQIHREKLVDVTIVEKIIRSMTAKFNYIICSIEESKDIDTLSIDELQSSLLEEEVSLIMVCHTKEKTHQNLWYLDTGCSNHICGDKNAFSDLDESFRNTGNTPNQGKFNSISNVFFVPDLKTNLFSVVGVNHQLIIFGFLGAIVYAHIADEKRKKLDDKDEKCIFLGVSYQSKAYKLYNPITKKIVISRDVVFDEERTWSWNINTVEQCIPTTFDSDGGEIIQQPLHHLVPTGPVLEIPQNQVPPATTEANEEVDTIAVSYEGKMLIVCLYVDDLIYTGNDSIMIEKFKENMMLEFDMSDLGKMYYFLGLEVVQSIAGVFVS
ncbi:hypothetical protein ACOSQ2_006503 [Xanthoceras sorbifolium]